MKGWVYVIGSFEHFNYVKVGISCDRTPIKRLSQLQCGNPFHLHLYACYPVMRGEILKCESIIHKRLAFQQVRNEWFKGHPSEISRIVEEEVVRFNAGSKGNSLVMAMSQAVSMSLEDADWLASPAVGREML